MKLLNAIELLIIVNNTKQNLTVRSVKNIQKNINPRVSGTSNGKLIILSKCATCGSKKSRFIKKKKRKKWTVT